MNHTLTIKTVTPEIAANWLADQQNFRKLCDRTIRLYMTDMRAGAWVLGEPIVFDEHGRLLNGFHRLNAVVRAGVAVPFIVYSGPTDVAALDRGRQRTISQWLSYEGEKNTSTLASVIARQFQYERTGMPVHQGGSRMTLNQARDVLNRHPDIRKFANLGRDVKFINRSLWVWFAYHASKYDKQSFDQFHEALRDGAHLSDLDPALHLRNRLQKEYMSKSRLIPLEEAALLIKAWAAFVDQRPVTNLRWRTRGSQKEDFPEMPTKNVNTGNLLGIAQGA